MNYRILPPQEMLEAHVTMPLSKSISNRMLIINHIAGGGCLPEQLAECDDTRILREALASAGDHEVNIGNAGTAMRFLAALYAATPGCEVTLTGSERMCQRPIGTLVEALRSLGADISYPGEEGFPPLKIKGGKLRGGDIEIDAQVSSQFISALLMVAPLMENPLHIILSDEAVSLPYIKMTLSLLERHGIDCSMTANEITVTPGAYKPAVTPVEGDWSAAAFWYELEALSSGMVTLDGLEKNSIQGDAKVAEIFANLGVITEFEGEEGGIDLVPSPDYMPRLILDMAATPDLVPAVAVTAAVLGIPFRLSGLASLRIKESDRVEAIIDELDKIGILVECENNTLIWEGRRKPINEMPRFDSHGDHRLAMALAPVSIFIPAIVVCDAEVVDKSYPLYWEHLKQAGFRLLDGDAPLPVVEDDEEDE